MPFAIQATTGTIYDREPAAVCDACHRRILDAGHATYLYDSDNLGASIVLACTAECETILADGKRELRPGRSLREFIVQMSLNTGVIGEDDARRLL